MTQTAIVSKIVYGWAIGFDPNLAEPVACLVTKFMIRLLIKPADVFVLVTLTAARKCPNYRNVSIGEALTFYEDPRVEKLQWFSAIGPPRQFSCKYPIPGFFQGLHDTRRKHHFGTDNVFHSTGYQP